MCPVAPVRKTRIEKPPLIAFLERDARRSSDVIY
jgi:hypothetical protein